MALLDIFGETPSYYGGLLGDEELRKAKDYAQSQGLQNAAMALLQAGAPSRTPGGGALAIAQGLQMGQQAYKQAMQQGLEDKLNAMKVGQMLQDLKSQQQMKEIFPQVFKQVESPEMTAFKQQQSMLPEYERGMMQAPNQATTLQVDPNKLQALAMMSKDPLAAYANIAKMVPDLRKAGFIGGQQQENPFSVYTQDQTIPEAIRGIARQYETSYSRGMIDPEKVDERIKQLGEMTNRATTFAQTQDALNQQRQFMNDMKTQQMQMQAQGMQNTQEYKNLMAQIAQGNLALRQQVEQNKPEQFSYSQKKEFDQITEAKDEAKKADTNASIAKRAAPLLEKAYGGVLEAGVKGVAGAVGISTEAKDANDKLMQLSNQLAVNAPKFSGPTSDRDAARYDAAVGDLANPKKSIESKRQALKDIEDLARKSKSFATQQENYFFENKKSLRGFKFNENPYEGM